jgi:transcriptional regulator of acetoin/glycerol metabolism
VRQLRHLLRTMIALRATDRLTMHDLPPEYRAGAALGLPAAPASVTADSPTEAAMNPLESAERQALLQELQRHEWNLSGVARELGISRNTLYRKLQRLNIKTPDKSLCH